MDRLNGWQRLWILFKWLMAIAAFVLVPKYVPTPDFNDPASPPPTNGQMAFGYLFIAPLAGTAMFYFLSALEWVYRGFRPVVNDPMEAVRGIRRRMSLRHSRRLGLHWNYISPVLMIQFIREARERLQHSNWRHWGDWRYCCYAHPLPLDNHHD